MEIDTSNLTGEQISKLIDLFHTMGKGGIDVKRIKTGSIY